MDYYENGFFEELVALRSDPQEMGMEMEMGLMKNISNYYCNDIDGGWQSGDSFGNTTLPTTLPPISAVDECFPFQWQSQEYGGSLADLYHGGPQLFGNDGELWPPHFADSLLPFPSELSLDLSSSSTSSSQILEPVLLETPAGSFGNIAGCCPEKEEEEAVKSKVKKVHGQPSKNLMAERRRRKRLNDRLSMLRSVVPKISKMDRTSILGDTIDYMKELLGKINSLQEEMDVGKKEMGILKNVKPNEMEVKISPKFEVESSGEVDTKIEICCGGKPGLLLTTVATLEALGLEIEQCVISCFNDFSMQASCTMETEQRKALSSEDIRQALFRNAGCGGKCF
ncbi:unnamed protein product [Cuscuta europaea]|uniref:BHLH domain-containing protein n=1 Tax=Cuscuta europaea TaxID=41803 RepID=A0A9P0YVC1_CUSEU|nr:unnamed protein product [Cuscuta europaea]